MDELPSEGSRSTPTLEWRGQQSSVLIIPKPPHLCLHLSAGFHSSNHSIAEDFLSGSHNNPRAVCHNFNPQKNFRLFSRFLLHFVHNSKLYSGLAMVVNVDSKVGAGITESMGIFTTCIKHFEQMVNLKNVTLCVWIVQFAVGMRTRHRALKMLPQILHEMYCLKWPRSLSLDRVELLHQPISIWK